MPFDLGPWAALWLGAVFFLAALVRGYAGFGFSAIVLTGGALATDPRNLVAVCVLADILLTAQQVRSIRGSVAWRRVGLLFAGCIVGVPVGVWVIAGVGADGARAVIALFVLAMCGVLAAGWHMRAVAPPPAWAATGLASGLANGAAVGGLPVAAFMAAQPIGAAAFRATNIAYYTLLDLWTLPVMAWGGLVSRDSFLAALLFLVPMSLGVWLGGRRFAAATPAGFRRFAILLLAVLALLALGRAVI